MVFPAPASHAAESAPLAIEARIALGEVSGRIDHLAVDLRRQRLYVAELGNDSVGVIDLGAGKLLQRLKGLAEPQGVAYEAVTDTLYVTNAGDRSARLFSAGDLTPAGRIDLGEDPDNIRADAGSARLYVGYGAGALAVLDPVGRKAFGKIPLKGHPESFQIGGDRIFVNVPDAREIAVVDRDSLKQVAAWPQKDLRANFAMALDETSGRLAVAFRDPPVLGIFDVATGARIGRLQTCRDADDVFIDRQRRRIYVSCGEGLIDTVEQREGGYVRLAHLSTALGARTSLYVPELDRLYVAVRSAPGVPAAIWVVRPSA